MDLGGNFTHTLRCLWSRRLTAAVQRAANHLAVLPPGGYREFVALGIHRLAERVRAASDVDAGPLPPNTS